MILTYGANDISEDKRFLTIELDHQLFQLKLTNVGSSTPIYIAWLDTHPDHNDVDPKLPHASAVVRANCILKLVQESGLNISTIITPDSTKSIPSIVETVDIASTLLDKKLTLIILPGGKDKEKVTKESFISPVVYHNVTSPTDDKFLGILEKDYHYIHEHNTNGKGIVLIDDVYTTGGTDIAMQTVLNTVFAMPTETRHPMVVLAAESTYGKTYPIAPPSHVFSCIHLPEFVGGLPTV